MKENLVHRLSWHDTVKGDHWSLSLCPRGSSSCCEMFCDLWKISSHFGNLQHPVLSAIIHNNKTKIQIIMNVLNSRVVDLS